MISLRPAPNQARKSQNFAVAKLKADFVEIDPDRPRTSSTTSLARRLWKEVLVDANLSSRHQRQEALFVHAPRRVLTDQFAISEDRDLVADIEDLLRFMRDENNALPFRPQGAEISNSRSISSRDRQRRGRARSRMRTSSARWEQARAIIRSCCPKPKARAPARPAVRECSNRSSCFWASACRRRIASSPPRKPDCCSKGMKRFSAMVR